MLIAQTTTQSLPELSIVFVPFMLGTISLIMFLSGRNTYLAGRVRDLCKELRDDHPAEWKSHVIMQIQYFASRYKISNFALLLSITSVFCFGSMIASTVLMRWNWTANVFVEFPIAMCVIGGVSATVATFSSLYETYIARRSLMTHVVASIVMANLTRGDAAMMVHLLTIESMARGIVEEHLHGQLCQLQLRIGAGIVSGNTSTSSAEAAASPAS